ncbi:MAG: hypothetical protein Q7V15_01095 [Phenylobacterium sp.]|uniref:hypothetical protein n=1 Tax=Phenylobacterium sp. TaxID=1871053 RepID=UPI00271CF169|nr:hypothetical protein [Phenylobacterium sp.]MDO8899932.1 hypothetical protein [Phenylobacterium sp.]
MKFVAVVAAVSAIAAAGSASALEMKDMEYLQAVRCHALAGSSLIQADTSAINALVRNQTYGRTPYVQERAKTERSRAARQARSSDEAVQAQVRGEVAGACQAWLGGEEGVKAARASAPSAG